MSIRKVLTVSLALAMLIFPLTALAGEPVKVTVRVDGLSCPFCAYGLEKKIQMMEGVEEVTINVDRGTVEVEFRDKEFIEKDKLEEAVKEAGFTPGKIMVEDIGE